MAVVIMADTPGMTAEQYEAVIADIGLTEKLPPGCRAHMAGPGPDGAWRVVTAWDDLDTARDYITTTVRPAWERAGVTPPDTMPINWPLHKLFI
jgi:hypothetical protein